MRQRDTGRCTEYDGGYLAKDASVITNKGVRGEVHTYVGDDLRLYRLQFQVEVTTKNTSIDIGLCNGANTCATQGGVFVVGITKGDSDAIYCTFTGGFYDCVLLLYCGFRYFNGRALTYWLRLYYRVFTSLWLGSHFPIKGQLGYLFTRVYSLSCTNFGRVRIREIKHRSSRRVTPLTITLFYLRTCFGVGDRGARIGCTRLTGGATIYCVVGEGSGHPRNKLPLMIFVS